MQTNIGDKYIFHSENGMDYSIRIVNINDFRQTMKNMVLTFMTETEIMQEM